jgi:hypothetical protein
MPGIPEYEIYAMKYAERLADLSTFMLGVEPGGSPAMTRLCCSASQRTVQISPA